MKKLFFTGLFLLCCLWLRAQNVTGKVYREGTNSVIPGATVYYGGSMAGTITNADGSFELQAKSEQIPVIVSCIGYYSGTITYKPGQPLIVYLKPKQEQLKVVTIRADGMDRSEEIALFIREFIGISDYARSCTITNIDDVDFFYDRKTETLTASSDKPLIIENKKLGYTINYYLDTFSRTSRNVYYAGNYIFKDNMPATVQAQAKIKSNRENVYQFSRMQIDEGDIIRNINENHQYIAHYHTGGVPGRNEIDDSQELYYPAIMRAIKNTGFKGYVAQEFIPIQSDPIASLKKAVEICDV